MSVTGSLQVANLEQDRAQVILDTFGRYVELERGEITQRSGERIAFRFEPWRWRRPGDTLTMVARGEIMASVGSSGTVSYEFRLDHVVALWVLVLPLLIPVALASSSPLDESVVLAAVWLVGFAVMYVFAWVSLRRLVAWVARLEQD